MQSYEKCSAIRNTRWGIVSQRSQKQSFRARAARVDSKLCYSQIGENDLFVILSVSEESIFRHYTDSSSGYALLRMTNHAKVGSERAVRAVAPGCGGSQLCCFATAGYDSRAQL